MSPSRPAVQRVTPNRLLRTLAGVILTLVLWSPAGAQSRNDGLPAGFVHLRAVDGTIVQDIRYATDRNFVGRRLPGYDAPECVLAEGAARALKDAQGDLSDRGLSLKIFDCYRPSQAVEELVRWVRRPEDPGAKAVYHPRVPKHKLFPTYIAARSGHSRGMSVDLTIVDIPKLDALGAETIERPCRNTPDLAALSAELDMGTAFDCFDPASRTDAAGLTQLQRNNRQLLVSLMKKHGFKNYSGEWWHFTYTRRRVPETSFDFPIPPFTKSGKAVGEGRESAKTKVPGG